ncbi:hypothetical protein BCR34DRAFT_207143 [Clohesyomyces aquaticus]|uniref:Gfd2/YDR514C-like C-terminal domain-containing protein n=1 Tax=Clohesyomyces aquaticus TaxID=1231657 RepID=A0A1Y2A9I2_9PLEO|nr:hypothetical protein BCR34DRAFT_207143 [Clohesyomyces aquaticus]
MQSIRLLSSWRPVATRAASRGAGCWRRPIFQGIGTRPAGSIYAVEEAEERTLEAIRIISPELTSRQRKKLKAAIAEEGRMEELAKSLKASSKSMVFSVDVEKYESGNEILEVGVAVYVPHTPTILAYHFIVSDNLHLSNGRFVKDNRHKFLYGESIHIPLKSLQYVLARYFSSLRELFDSCTLVGHSIQNDIAWLNTIDLHIPRDTPVLDIADVWMARYNQATVQTSSLKKMLTALEITAPAPHNGGNDAYHTLKVALEMMEIYVDLSLRVNGEV